LRRLRVIARACVILMSFFMVEVEVVCG